MDCAGATSTRLTLERGQRRFRAFSQTYKQHTKRLPRGSILDFGCGYGGFLAAALDGGLNAYGIEVSDIKRASFRKRVAGHARRDALIDRFRLYDGKLLPFASGYFDLVHSYFVFEHVPDTTLSLREVARVTKTGGYVEIYAEDARNAWDGHACIPWPPFMPRAFARSWLRPFGLAHQAEFIRDEVVYITAPMVSDVLRTAGFEILYETPRPEREAFGMDIANDYQASVLAKDIKARFDAGEFPPPVENLHVVAQKRR